VQGQHDKKMDMNDYSLTDDAAYYPANDHFEEYLKLTGNIPELSAEVRF
jgi:hypothetical protein